MTDQNAQTSSSPKDRDAKPADKAEDKDSPDVVLVYKLEEIGSTRTFRQLYGPDYGKEADRLGLSGRTIQPGSHVVIFAPGAETRAFKIPEPTDTMLATLNPHLEVDAKSQNYIDPRPSPEVDPKLHPEAGKKIAEQQKRDEDMRVGRLRTGEEFKGETPDERSRRFEYEQREHDAKLREAGGQPKPTQMPASQQNNQPASQQQGAQDRDQKAEAMKRQLQRQNEIV